MSVPENFRYLEVSLHLPFSQAIHKLILHKHVDAFKEHIV